jgi:hydroxymethylglutaryl-CoA synthase
MVGITSYGGYIPWYRINRMTIYGAIGTWLNPASLLPGEKAVSNWDEDSVSMAVNAAIDCLTDVERDKVDGLYFATTTSPFMERQAASIIATALDLGPEIRTADIGGSISGAASAVLTAADTIKAGSAKNIMVCTGDCRIAKAGGPLEEQYGDGAAALLMGDEGVIASLDGSYTLSYDIMDHFRVTGDKFNRQWEDRWIRDEGFGKFIGESLAGLMKKYGLSAKDFAKVCYPCLYPRAHGGIAKKLGFEAEQVQDSMFSAIGNTGAPYPLMVLIAALEDAKPGDKILVASYGNGSDALYLQVTDEIEKVRDRRGIKSHLASRRDLTSYEKYVTFRDILDIDTGGRGDEIGTTQISTLWRERRTVLGLCGSRCKRCGTPQYPEQEVCVNPKCGAVNEMESYRFSDKKGHLFTYTGDVLAFSPSPPAIYGTVDFEGGGRWMFDLNDCELESLEVGMPVEMSFRRKYHDVAHGIHGYYWKATPIRG